MSDQEIEKREQSSNKKKRADLIWRLAALIAVLVLVISLWQLSGILLEYHNADSAYDDIVAQMGQETVPVPTRVSETQPRKEQETPEDLQETEETEMPEETEAAYALTVPDFDYLRSVNSDVIGWIQIPGTKINYPIVQGTDNEYYLTHTVSGEENSSGAIFMDAAITDGFDDRNPIIHGHNMKSGAMFSRLNRYSRKSFWDANRYIYITTPEGFSVYEVFSAYSTDPTSDVYYFGFGNDDQFQAYLDRITSYSIFDAGISVTKDDYIVTLSTCANDTSQRFVVHAKRIQN